MLWRISSSFETKMNQNEKHRIECKLNLMQWEKRRRRQCQREMRLQSECVFWFFFSNVFRFCFVVTTSNWFVLPTYDWSDETKSEEKNKMEKHILWDEENQSSYTITTATGDCRAAALCKMNSAPDDIWHWIIISFVSNSHNDMMIYTRFFMLTGCGPQHLGGLCAEQREKHIQLHDYYLFHCAPLANPLTTLSLMLWNNNSKCCALLDVFTFSIDQHTAEITHLDSLEFIGKGKLCSNEYMSILI